MPFALLSHGLNVVVLALVLRGLWSDSVTMSAAYGMDAPARRILACVYLAIALASAAALVFALATQLQGAVQLPFVWFSLSLFAIQIVYKLATVAVVGTSNPVVIANLGIAAFHAVSCVALVVAISR